MNNEIVSGQRSSWTLLKKLGEGDAGEVYLVESLIGGRKGVLKRPQKSAYASDVVRQATQIRNEGALLAFMANVGPIANGGVIANGGTLSESKLRLPELLDQSKPGSEFTAAFFIILEIAPGFDLSFLLRTARMGLPDRGAGLDHLSAMEKCFLDSIAEQGIPARILLACLDAILATLIRIHTWPVELNGLSAAGIIYNDLKPEHIFWDPQHSSITLIDWGNSQLVDRDGTSRDRQYSTRTDFIQFIEEMGKFLAAADPDLRRSLDWPGRADGPDQLSGPDDELFLEGGLVDRIQAALQANSGRLKEVRDHERELLQPLNASENTLLQLEEVQRAILSLGDVPDYPGAARAAAGFAARLVMADQVKSVERVAQWALQLPGIQEAPWKLVARLAGIAGQNEGDVHRCFLDALQAAICADGETVLWQLLIAIQDAPEPVWWFEVIGLVRNLALGLAPDSLLPLTAARRLSLSLQSQMQQMDSGQNRRMAAGQENGASLEMMDCQNLDLVARSLQEDILASWTRVDPDPPHAFLDYADLDRLLGELGASFSAEIRTLEHLLNQAKAQVKLILDAWECQEFSNASQRLRHLAVWDPDRRRVLRANQMLLRAPAWLKKVHLGPHFGENFREFITGLEFEGRELRNHVGPAAWLDGILDSLSRLRKGAWPADLLPGAPLLAHEMPWLKRYERVEHLPVEVIALAGQEVLPSLISPVSLPTATTLPPTISGKESQPSQVRFVRITGIQESSFGAGGSLYALAPLDSWAPEARGSSARVYLGEYAAEAGLAHQFALKLMRMDKTDYALPLFREEVQILAQMDSVAGVSRMLECGFIYLPEKGVLPPDTDLSAIGSLNGDLVRIGLDAWPNFASQLEERVDSGWTPYLALEKRAKEACLLVLCDASQTHGQFQPMVTLMQMSIQICDILQAAHERNIVYRDHKILHYYWQNDANGVYMIDWNVARLHPDGLTEVERQMDLVQFGARGLHHILTGRAAPGALPLGPTRPEEIEQAAKSYTAQWTYDDQRLPQSLRDILTAVLAGGYSHAAALRDDLKKTCMSLPYSGD